MLLTTKHTKSLLDVQQTLSNIMMETQLRSQRC